MGAVLAGIVMAFLLRSAGRHRRARALHPDAVLVEAEDAAVTGAALGVIRGGNAPAGHAYTVAFTDAGMHVYQGQELSAVTELPWSDIVAVREEQVRVSTQVRPALVVEVRAASGVVALPLVIPAPNAFTSPTGRVERAASAVDARRRSSAHPAVAGAGRSTVASSAVSHVTPPRRELLPGIPSTRWLAWAKPVPYLGGAVVVVGLLVQLFSGAGVSRAGMIPAMLCVLGLTLVTASLFLLAGRAAKREAAAGYTLQRLGPVELEQLDPKTGFVIRAAGEPQLTRDQEAAAMQRTSRLT